jgi:pyruvate/2-oxoglutarate dehydrogenase complex dihydrolipoamide dehydrogenase (E3) component
MSGSVVGGRGQLGDLRDEPLAGWLAAGWLDGRVSSRRQRVVILGGGPGGYEAALVAAQLGADVTVVDRDGLGGACVLTDCVPSKALIATADARTRYVEQLGTGSGAMAAVPDLAEVNAQIKALAAAQSEDIGLRLKREGVTVVRGSGRLGPAESSATRLLVEVDVDGVPVERLDADFVLIATGAAPRVMSTALPDGERILTWQQIYDLPAVPERLIVVGSGVTGAELAHGYLGLGAPVVLVSSRDRVLPGEDADAAEVIEGVFRRRGMEVLNRSRAAAVRRTSSGDGVVVDLEGGRSVEGSHCLLAVGSVPNTGGIGLVKAGIELTDSGHIDVDRVSRTGVRGVYAAGDCTGLLPLASVAAMQGRIAMWHALGDAVSPINLKAVAANIFTDPEIATVGYSEKEIREGKMDAKTIMLPLATNARAKMEHLSDGFVKLFARPGTGIVVGGVVVAARASELIFPVALAVAQKLTVDQVASAFTIYPSMSGSIAEAARQLHVRA